LIGLDAVSAIPFARLRQENRPKKYAFVKIAGILVNIIFTVFFLVFVPKYTGRHPDGWLAHWYHSNSKVGMLILANLFQNLFVFLVLFKEWKQFRFRIDAGLWKQIFAFSSPMIIIGLAGMVNEVMDRQMLEKFLPLPEPNVKRLVGIYSANYKLAIFITLFINAFKMAAEPFFFNQAKDQNVKFTYAKVLKWFSITLCIAFLFTALYLDVWINMIGKAYRSGVGIVPVLLFANICLGIYYNISVWYKITDRMRLGLYITVMGAAITFAGNIWFIPKWGMYASAWTTLTCYATMVVVTYFVGQKYYPVPYPVKKILTYLTVMLLLFFLKVGVDKLTYSLSHWPQLGIRFVSASILMGLFLLLVLKVERAELKGMPVIGKYLR
jgi:O-antigen/teichoic acid export membrane protein